MEEIYSEEYGGPSGYYTYTYDGNDRLLNKIWHSEVSYATSGDYYYTYDASGLLIGYEKWAFGEQKEHCGFSYSSDGFLLEYSDIIDGYCVTFLYGEISLDEAIAESAAEWSRSGVRALYASDPE